MTRESLLHQADRAEALAAQTADGEIREALLKAAQEYRAQLENGDEDADPE
ncbi:MULTISPECIES: hypothetical protein [unclassified Bradyrhizobium]|uniref:hypothetical protein n=1 Tax=unclassified Bradyrhizobium TaxID=2631580 RepID=UPI001FF635E1|nr:MULTISPECIES: hypothetical protein [unclassified Bradyrhizobium]MCJ9702180.1 hypothetical protein [Bradyrhizobium sp. SHOUNA76]MCJ9731897.1 hypothetical protein [Bradyrhizobium sp. PRIMUS42]